jgi:hypothetical protein
MNDCIHLKVTGTLQGILKNAALVKGLETSNLHCKKKADDCATA